MNYLTIRVCTILIISTIFISISCGNISDIFGLDYDSKMTLESYGEKLNPEESFEDDGSPMFVYREYTGMGHTFEPCYLDDYLFPWLCYNSLEYR